MNSSVMIKIREFFKADEYNHEITLSKNRVYIVPEYQREIRWKAENAKILIEDLLISAKFLGTVFISSKCENNINYELIDGQQRVTVLLMIYWVFARKYPSANKYQTCGYINNSYKYLFEACDVDFNISLLAKKYQVEESEFYQSDVLEQTDKFKELWETICGILDSLTPAKEHALFENLIKSEINLILNSQPAYEVDDRTCVNYFLDINDRSVSLDDVDIFKGYLFKNDFDNMTTRWEGLQRKLKLLRNKGLHYPVLSVLEHYILCNANKKLDYKIKKLMHFKITRDVRIYNDEYKEGRHILDLIHEPEFGKKMMDDLDDFFVFIQNVLDDAKGTAECYSKYFNVAEGEKLDSFTKLNCIDLIRRIILNDNVVPKLLVMKYFFERLQNTHCKKSDYKEIYNVYLCCIMFSLIDTNKASASFSRIAMNENWEELLAEKSVEYMKKTVWRGNYSRKIEKKGMKPEDGAKFFPKDVACVFDNYHLSADGRIKPVNENSIHHFWDSNTITSEHLFVNRSYTFTVHYGGGVLKTKCPSHIKKYVSYIGNYLCIDEKANRDIGNAPIWEKIQCLNHYIEQKESLGCKFADIQFKLIKESFSGFPDMDSILSEEEAEEAFNLYYANFEERYKTYMEKIKSESILIDKQTNEYH